MEVLIDLMSNNLIGTTLWLTTAIAGYIYSRKWINNEYKYSDLQMVLKKWWIRRKINKWQMKHYSHPIDYSYEKSLEFSESNDKNDLEELTFFGADENGSVLLINFNRSETRNEIWLYFLLKDGRILTLPDHEATTVNSNDGTTIKCKGLTLELLKPYSKWRITYNGFLRVHENEISTESGNRSRVKLQHVIFTFFWTVASKPLLWPNRLNAATVAENFSECNTTINDELLIKLLSEESGFVQCGSLFGQATIENETKSSDVPSQKEVFELSLPGIRRKKFRLSNGQSNDLLSSSASIFGVCRDGFVFFLEVKSFDDNSVRIPFGVVRMPNGMTSIIDTTDLDLDPLNLTKAKISFKDQIRLYEPEFHFNIKQANKIYEGRPINRISYFSSASILQSNGIPGHGLVLWKHPLKDTDPKPVLSNIAFNEKFQKNELVHPIDTELNKTVLVASFKDACAQNETLCGGKGASLAFMVQIKQNSKKLPCPDFTVPDGFVLTTNAYKFQVLRNSSIREGIVETENSAFKRINKPLENACSDLSEIFKNTPILPEIVDQVKRVYEKLEKESKIPLKLAVRSSAVGEDSAGASSAGQNETFLGLKSIEEVLHAIRKCWASLFTYQSVSYRQQNIQPINTEMAVVIQTMVPSDSAGVLFTNYPLNNDPNKILVTANFGLGESVVSGTVDPDTFTILREYNDESLRVIQKQKGQKEHFIHMSSESEILATSRAEIEKRQKYCLTEEQILKLSEIGVFLEYCYGSPRDIEWAVFENNIYLLQSRPMTSINAFSSWELLHEFDSAVMSPEDLCTFANVGEVLPEALSPLTLTSFQMLGVTAQIFPKNNFSGLYSKIGCSSHFRVALQVYNLFFGMVGKEISLADRVYGLSIFGHDYITDEMHKIAVHRNGVASTKRKNFAIWDLIRSCWNVRKVSDDLQKNTYKFIGTYDLKNLEKFKSLPSLFDDMQQKMKKMSDAGCVHSLMSKVSSVYQVLMFTVLVEGKKEFNTDHYADIALMLSSCKDVESAEIPMLLEDIARAISKSGKQKEFSLIDVNDGIIWLKDNCKEAHKLFEEFLRKNCHRAFKEFDFATVTWGMKPASVIEMLQVSTRNITDLNSFKPRKEKTDAEIIASLKSPKRAFTRWMIKFLLPLCKTSVQLRERSKSNYIAHIHELRKAYRYLGTQMYEKGFLPDPELIFYLSYHELGQILKDKNFQAISKSIRRRRLQPEWRKFRFAELQYGVIRPIEKQTNPGGKSGPTVTGTPVCEGVITARACVVENFSEVSKLQNGDILITHSTDIGWSPYFPILGGVVTELGGLISHGAVVAREYGLPCIVGAANATHVISDGDIVNMNANTGVITKIN